LIKKNIKHHQSTLPKTINIEATSIIISTEKLEIKIISVYNPPNKKILREDISQLFQGMLTILLGDLISKHQIWGCQKTKPNGNKLLNFTCEQGIIISPPTEPTFQRSGKLPDILYIVLISNLPIDLHHQILNKLNSDHVPVISTLNEQIIVKNPITKQINAPINWDAFRKNLDDKLNNQKRYRDLDNINKSIEHITDTIKISVTQAQTKNAQLHLSQPTISKLLYKI